MDELSTRTKAAVPSVSTPADVAGRASARARALRLEHLTVGYNIVEGLIAVIAATAVWMPGAADVPSPSEQWIIADLPA